MFDLINGLPVHPLVVHAVVVLLPLAALGTAAIAVRPRWRARYGPLVTAIALLSVLLIPVATSSGESLQERVGNPGQHAELGDQLIWFALPLLVLVGALTWLDRRERDSARGEDQGSAAPRAGRIGTQQVIAGLAILAAVAVGVQVYRVGDSGARAVWGGEIASTSPDGGHDDD